MRPALALLAGAATAAFGALVLGEYQLTGLTGVIAGVLFGLAIGELLLAAGGRALSGQAIAPVAAALFTVGGLTWAAWRSASLNQWSEVPVGAWIGIALGAVAAPLWFRSGARRSSSAPQQ